VINLPARARGALALARARSQIDEVRPLHSTIRLLPCFAVLAAAACDEHDLSAPPPAVFALFDPAGMPPTIPLPNEVAMLAAQPNTPAVASFSGALAPASVRADDVLAIDLGTATPIVGVSPTFDPTTAHLVVMPPPTGWPVGRVAVVLRAGETGLRGANNEPVVATPAFFFARSPLPVASCTSPQPGCSSMTPVLTLSQAIGLEQLRQAYAPLFAALDARGLPRDQVALLWTFVVNPAP
jgi:hypothetical protein